ncbi:C69 family dipeptidase [candidate division KSB1 bacterium]|nr:C69 family dipeptidase [candidate division KSB1 bacterium]
MGKRFIYLILIFGLVDLLFIQHAACRVNPESEFDCFSIIVGREASIDGSVLMGHNEDDGGRQIVNYYKVPRRKYSSGATITLSTGAIIPQVEETFEYLWFEMPGMNFSDSYINEWGVAIASDQCRSREDSAQLKDGGIKYWLRRLVAERARSARDGVRIAGKIVSEIGYAASGRTYVIADPAEGWMFAAVHGKHWIAQRVPDDKVAVIPNYYTFGEINLADTLNFLGSPDIIEYAVKKGWYDPAADGAFHFARVYSERAALTSPGNIPRMWRGVNLLAGKAYSIDAQFPFAFEPKKKLSVADLFVVLRDHYENTEFDKTQGYQLGSPNYLNGSTICADATQNSFVAQLRRHIPIEIGAVIWLSQHRPDTQAFVPWYLGITKIPDGYAFGNPETALTQHFNPSEETYDMSRDHAFWSFFKLAEKVDENYGALISTVRKRQDELEKNALKKQAVFEKKVVGIYHKNPQAAKQMLTEYTSALANEARRIAEKLTHE